jgi:peptidoglycan-N-acetylglucosamine deacetylase
VNLRRLNIIPLLLLVLLIPASNYYPGIKWWGLGVIILMQLAILVYGCMNISSGYFLPVLCNADTDKKVVALTFDDGPHPVHTPAIVDTLKRNNVPAAFFVMGKNIIGNETILQQIFTGRNTIGNHSFSHAFWFDMYGSKKMLADMQQTDEAIQKLLGVKPLMFRPPYGVINPNVKSAIKKGRYIPIGWSIRSLDTTIKDKEKLLNRIISQLRPGAIILLHDTMEITMQILPQLIETIRGEGYEIKGLDEMLNIRAYA